MPVDTTALRQQLITGAQTAVEFAVPMLIGSLTGLVWDWQSGGDRDEFPEHRALNGAFAADAAGFGGWEPGDHAGCRCQHVDVRETTNVVSISGGALSAVATVEFGVGFSEEPLSVSLSVGGTTVSVVAPGSSGPWDALILQLDQRWPDACQRAVDAGAFA